jgi:CBS-domain-containing membrane protein
MLFFDKNFLNDKLRYVLQCSLAAVGVLISLALLKSISNAAVIAALGASTFIVFVLPQTQSARARYLIGGYICGVAVGVFCYWLRHVIPLPQRFGAIPEFPQVVLGAAAVGLATFVMVVTNSEHPPAAGLSLGFVFLDEWRWMTPVAVLAAICVLCLTKRLLKRALHNLL